MAKKRNLCRICGKRIGRKKPLDAGILDAGGWTERCAGCGSLLWVPVEEEKPVELVVVPAIGSSELEPEEIFFEETKLLGLILG